MTFRIEEKLLINKENILDFKKYIQNKSAKKIYQRRKIESLYFENANYQMYTDSIEGLTPRKKSRIRSYPETKDNKFYLETKISKDFF